MAADIKKWLEDLGLDQYAEVFAKNDIDFRALPHLDQNDLKELGVSLGHRKVILAAINAMDEARETAVDDPNRSVPTGGTEQSIAFGQPQVERRQLTIMFCDLVGSTELSGRLDPEDLRAVMRRYQDSVAGLVARFGGHVAKFLGDGVLAYFGWPRAFEDQAERAVRTGLAAVEAVADLKTEDGQALAARVGIATGQVVIGDIVGEAATETDAVTGETPNLAARLLEVASPGQVAISSATRLLIGEALDLEDIGTHRLKGFAEPVAAWRAVGESTAKSRFEAARPRTSSRFVGREHELGLLKRAWQQSQTGIGQVVLISGEPGIGKSRLVDALNAELGYKAYTRITLSCSPYHASSALYPIIVHFERVLGWQPDDDADVKLTKLEEALQGSSLPLGDVIPLFAGLLSLHLPADRYAPLNLTPQQQKQQTLDATVAWLLEEAEHRPVLQVWEDLHWADPSTLELLTLEIEQAPTAPILNVLTFRPEFTPSWPQRSHITPLTLNRLERDEVDALIAHQAGDKALPGEVVEHIVAKTDGVPLYVEELTKAILEADFLRKRNGRYELVGQLSEVAIPATLQDSLMARLDRSPAIREVAQLGAVIGREFTYEMIQAITSTEEATLQEGLDRLVEAELLYQRGRPPRARYIFKHALVQDAAYQSLLKSRRQNLHRLIALAYESHFPEMAETRPEILAHHFTEAGDAARAIEFWGRAGQSSLRKSAHPEAIAQLRRGIDLIGTQPSSSNLKRKEIELQTALGISLISTQGYTHPDVRLAYERAKSLCEDVGDEEGIFTATWGLWIHHEMGSNFEIAASISDKLLDLAAGHNDSGKILQANHTAWTTCLSRGMLERSLKHTEVGWRTYDIDKHGSHAFLYGGHDPGVCSQNFSAWSTWILGFPDRALHHVQEAQKLARQLSHPFSQGTTHGIGAIIRFHRGERDEALHETDAARSLIQRHRFSGGLWTSLVTIVESRIQAEEGEANGAMAAVEGVLRKGDTSLFRPYYLASFSEICLKAQQPEKGLAAIDEAISIVQMTGERWWEPELHRLKGELLRTQGMEPSVVEPHFRRAIESAKEIAAHALLLRASVCLARCWRDQEKTSAARDLLTPVYEWFTDGLDTSDLIEAKGLLDELN